MPLCRGHASVAEPRTYERYVVQMELKRDKSKRTEREGDRARYSGNVRQRLGNGLWKLYVDYIVI